jgi:hypothetical protein
MRPSAPDLNVEANLSELESLAGGMTRAEIVGDVPELTGDQVAPQSSSLRCESADSPRRVL